MRFKRTLQVFSTASLIVSVVLLAFVSALLNDDDLQAYYPLDGTTGPVVNNKTGLNGTANTAQRGVPGILGNAFEYGGQDQNHSVLPYINNMNANFSFSIWLNFTSTGNRIAISSNNTGDTSNAPDNEMLKFNNPKLEMGYRDASGDSMSSVTGGVDIENNLWQHFAVSLNADTRNMTIWWNGTIINSSEGFATFPASFGEFNVANITIGGPVGAEVGNDWIGVIDELGIWNRTLTNTEVTSLYNVGAGLAFPFSGTPTVTLNLPANNTFLLRNEINFTTSLTALGDSTLQNATLFIWYPDGTILNQTTTALTGASNSTSWNITNIPSSKFMWNVESCGGANLCAVATNNFTFTLGIANITASRVTPTWETAFNQFNITFNATGGTPINNFYYNGTLQSGTTTTSLGGNMWRSSSSFDIPLARNATQNIVWETIVGTLRHNTSQTQAVGFINMTICSAAPQDIRYMNFSYHNETVANERVTAFISASTWNYYLGKGTVNETYIYSDSGEAGEHNFCFNPDTETVKTTVSYSYDNAESQQRTFNPQVLSLTSSVTDQDLLLLPTSDGIFITFQVVNAAGQPINGARVKLSRTGFGTVSDTTTGASGTSNVFLNPNFQYTLDVTAATYNDFTATQTFPTNEFTITLGSATTSSTDYIRGISTVIRPVSQVLANNTAYQFNYTINSTFWDLDSYGFVLTNGTGAILASNSSSTETNGGQLSTTINTGNYSLIRMEYFWEVNNSFNNRTIAWAVNVQTDGSILGFFNRLGSYMDDGFFGISKFGVAIFLFLFIFITVGILSFNFGLNAPIALTSAATIFVIFIETLGILPTLLGIQFLSSSIMVIILIILVLRGSN